MPWKEVSTMSQRHEFMLLAQQPGVSLRALCRQFEISPTTAYKWLARYATDGRAGLTDRSRRPHQMPQRTSAALEAAVLALRTQHPTWGGRKLHARLQAVGSAPVPAPSTITAMLRRAGWLPPAATAPTRAWRRFEHDTPNALWQMDFKGHFPVAAGRCHPLTVLDDCSRFALCLHACPHEQGTTVQTHLTQTFRRYGLPARILTDNGPPWGTPTLSPFTPLTVWLIRLGIALSHARPAHPQTLGKDERFHRTLKTELLHQRTFLDLTHCQQAFDRWRDHYNLDRPHDALALTVPATRYTPAPARFPRPSRRLTMARARRSGACKRKASSPFADATSASPKPYAATRWPCGLPPKRVGGGSIFVTNISASLICSSPQNNSQCVNHVPEHPLMMSPVYTPLVRGEMGSAGPLIRGSEGVV